MACCVKNCKNVRRLMTPDSNISFHRVPKNEYATYMKILGLEDETYKKKYVCSLHFMDDDFVLSKSRLKYIRKGALPSRNIGENVAVITNEDLFTSQGTEAYSRVVVETAFGPFETALCRPEEGGSPMCESTSPTSTPGKMRFSPLLRFEECDSKQGAGYLSDVKMEPESHTVLEGSETRRDAPNGSRSRGEIFVKSLSESPPSLSEGSTARTEFVTAIHSYSISPRELKRKLEESQKKIIKKSKQLYAAKKTIHKLKQKIASLTKMLKEQKRQRDGV